MDMEKAKKRRKAERTSFTKALNAFIETQISADVNHTSTVVAFKMLEDRMKELTTLSDAVMDLLFDDDTVSEAVSDKEIEDTRVYREKFVSAKVKYEKAGADIAATATTQSNGSGQNNNGATVVHERKARKYPTIELVKFSGNVREWLQFWSQFKKIHEDTDIVKEDKFQYLIQATTPDSRAADLVKSYPPTAANYDKVIESLKNCFGRDDIQIEVHVRELLQLVLQNAITPAKNVVLSTLYDRIESHLRAREPLGVTTDKCAAMLFHIVESSLPEELLRVWQRSSAQTIVTSTEDTNAQSKNRLAQLIKFLENEVQNELRISMAVQGFNLKPQPNIADGKNKADKVLNSKDIPSAMGLLMTHSRKKACTFCGYKEYDSAQCGQAKKMQFSELRDIVKRKNACFNCLNIGHSYQKCRVNLKCAWCSRKHVILMRPDVNRRDSEPKGAEAKTLCNLATFDRDPEVLLQTLRVTLYNGEEKRNVRLIIDSGSQRSYITKEAATRIGYEPIAEQLLCYSLFGVESSGTVKNKKYVVHIGSLNNSYKCNFTALDERVICDDVPSINRGPWCSEMRDLNIKLTDVDVKDDAVSILLGADIAGKLLTGKRHVLQYGLVAVETYLAYRWIETKRLCKLSLGVSL